MFDQIRKTFKNVTKRQKIFYQSMLINIYHNLYD